MFSFHVNRFFDWLAFHAEQSHDVNLLGTRWLLLSKLFGQRIDIKWRKHRLGPDPSSEPFDELIIDSFIATKVKSWQTSRSCQEMSNIIKNLLRQARWLKIEMHKAWVILDKVLKSIGDHLVISTQGHLCQTFSLLLRCQPPGLFFCKLVISQHEICQCFVRTEDICKFEPGSFDNYRSTQIKLLKSLRRFHKVENWIKRSYTMMDADEGQFFKLWVD